MKILIARRAAAAAALCGLAPLAAAQSGPGLFITPVRFSALVQENLLPGGNVSSDSQVVDVGAPGAPPSIDLLHTTARGSNFSGHAPRIETGFASAQSDGTGHGGVGVTNWLGGSPQPGSNAVGQLVSQVVWTQTITNTGGTDQALSLHLAIPAIEAGLIGVPPNRSTPSDTETARAEVRLDTSIHRADGSLVAGRSFDLGIDVHEIQLTSNVTDPRLIFGGDLGVDVLKSFHDNGSSSTPVFSLDALSFSFTMGTVQPGDILGYVYTLTAVGTTIGAEQGFQAFVGDPFDLSASGGPFSVSATPVPEPATWACWLAGLVAIARRMITRAMAIPTSPRMGSRNSRLPLLRTRK